MNEYVMTNYVRQTCARLGGWSTVNLIPPLRAKKGRNRFCYGSLKPAQVVHTRKCVPNFEQLIKKYKIALPPLNIIFYVEKAGLMGLTEESNVWANLDWRNNMMPFEKEN